MVRLRQNLMFADSIVSTWAIISGKWNVFRLAKHILKVIIPKFQDLINPVFQQSILDRQSFYFFLLPLISTAHHWVRSAIGFPRLLSWWADTLTNRFIICNILSEITNLFSSPHGHKLYEQMAVNEIKI